MTGGASVRARVPPRWLRAGALVGVAAVVAAYGSVLYEVTSVVGNEVPLVGLLAASIALATVVARTLRPRTALFLTAGLLAAGLVAYLGAVPDSQLSRATPGKLVGDSLAMLTGLSVLQLVAAGTWALTVAPGPTFLAWYLAMRRRYAPAVAVAGATLGLFVLTGDAGEAGTLLGVVAGVVAVGLGDLDRTRAARESTGATGSPGSSFDRGVGGDPGTDPGGTVDAATLVQIETLTAVVAAMVLVTASVGLAAGGVGSPVSLGGGDGGGGTTQASLLDASDELRAAGSISLSPKVRAVVHSDRRAYWRTAAYDRYTGEGWVRTGEPTPYQGPLPGPAGDTRRIRQTVVAQTDLDAMPAANAPVTVDDATAERTLVTPQGGIRPTETLRQGANYTVVSERPTASAERLRAAGDDYPDRIERDYRQLPSSTPDRVAERAADVAGAEPTAYDKAVAIERHLESEKSYSLEVDRPSGDVAAGFLFEMDAGYCVYFATAMVAMLRAQDVPARFVVGYTPGQQIDDGERSSYVVRGLDAHAWVEVYFPSVGWVRFDPTPAGPRRAVESERIREARASGEPNVDAAGSADAEISTPENDTQQELNASVIENTDPDLGTEDTGDAIEPTDQGPTLPSRRTVGLWTIALLGAAAAARRGGVTGEVRRAAGRYYQRRRDPETDAERAWQRVQDHLGRRYRPRRPGETPRAYLDSLAAEIDVSGMDVDRRAREVAEFAERARYGDGISPTEATGAVQRADTLTRRSLPLVGRWYRRSD